MAAPKPTTWTQESVEVVAALDALVKQIPEISFRLGAGDMTPAGVVRWVHDMLPPQPEVWDEPGSHGQSPPAGDNDHGRVGDAS